MKRLEMVALACLALLQALPVQAESTGITVRVKSKDAKFVGSSMGGALVTIRNADTGELLTKGVTVGTTGDTERLMRKPLERGALLSDEKSARFTTELDLAEPTLLEIKAYGPLAQRQAAASVTVTQWVVPGKHLTGGDGVLLELPGLAVAILEPPAHTTLPADALPTQVEIRVNLVMMCGCPVTPGGVWDAGKFEVRALVKRNGKPFGEVPLVYADEPSIFGGTLDLKDPGVYEITGYAYDPTNGNTGTDRTTVVVQP